MHKPKDFPATSFGRFLLLLVQRYYTHDVARDSAALGYYLLFAIFPLLVFVSSLLGLLQLDVETIVSNLSAFVPAEALGMLEAYLHYVFDNPSPALLWFSLVFSLWFPMRATGCLMLSVRKALPGAEERGFFRAQWHTLLFTLWLIAAIALALLLMTFGGRLLGSLSEWLALSPRFLALWDYLRFFLLALVMLASVLLLYMLALGRRQPLRQLLPGAVLSLAVWMLLSLGYSYYVENLAHYTQLYGSIAALVVLLVWLYMSGTVLIMGAEANGVIELLRRPRGEQNNGKEQKA